MTDNGIDVWQFPLDGGPEAVGSALELLSPDERIDFRRFENAQVARAFAIRRAARRIILARYLSVEPSDVCICDAPKGKPKLCSASNALHFSASHSKNRGIFAVARCFPVGVDVEGLRPIDIEPLAAHILSPSERLDFDHARPADRVAGVLGAWTAKEALVKGIGIGLDLNDLPLISLPFSAAPADWQPVRFDGRMMSHGRWYVCSLDTSGPYILNLAAPTEAEVNRMDARGLLSEHGV